MKLKIRAVVLAIAFIFLAAGDSWAPVTPVLIYYGGGVGPLDTGQDFSIGQTPGGSGGILLGADGTLVAGRIHAATGTAGPTALVSFVWDDGNDSNYDLLFPMFETQGEVGSLAIIINRIATADHLTWPEISAMADSGWEVISHSMTHPNFNDTLTLEELTAELVDSLAEFTAQGLDVESFAYPGGGNTYRIRTETAKYYRSGRGIGGEGYNPESLRTYGLAAFDFGDHTLLANYQGYVDIAEASKTWLIFYGHGTDSDDVTMTSTLVDYIQAKSIPIVTFSDALDLLENRIQIGDLGTGGHKADSSEPSGFAVGPWGNIRLESITFERGKIEASIRTNSAASIIMLNDDGDQNFTLLQNGKLGIGTGSTTPGVHLDTWGSISLGNTSGSKGILKSYYDRDIPTMFGRVYHSGAAAGLRIESSTASNTSTGEISFWTTPGTQTPVRRMTIDKDGVLSAPFGWDEIYYVPQTAEATTIEGTVARCDGSTWDCIGDGSAALVVYDGASWVWLESQGGDFSADGSVTATGAFNMGGYGFTNTGPIIGATTGSFSSTLEAAILTIDGDRLYYHVGAGTINLFIGQDAGAANTSGGNFNVAVGFGAGKSVTLADNTTYMGYQAGRFLTGINNTGIGTGALKGADGVSAGSENTALGSNAGFSNRSGQANLYFGYSAGNANTSGNQNVYFGSKAGQYALGDRNVYVGYEAGTGVSGQSTADDNFGMGWRSLNDATTGNKNVAVGTGTLALLTTGAQNVVFGYGAGAALISGNSNIFAGYQAGDATTSGVRNIIIGRGEDAPAADTDDHLNIGGLIYGDLANGKAGINDASPDAAWDVESKAAGDIGVIIQGAASQTANALNVQSSAGTVLFSIDKDGNVSTGAWAGNDIPLSVGGTGESLSDPGDHKVMGWDDDSNEVLFMTLGPNFAYNYTTDTLSGAGDGHTQGSDQVFSRGLIDSVTTADVYIPMGWANGECTVDKIVCRGTTYTSTITVYNDTDVIYAGLVCAVDTPGSETVQTSSLTNTTIADGAEVSFTVTATGGSDPTMLVVQAECN